MEVDSDTSVDMAETDSSWSFPVSGLPVPEPLVMCDTSKLDSPLLGYTRSPAILCRGAQTSSPYRTVTKRSAKRQKRRQGFSNFKVSPRVALSPLAASSNVPDAGRQPPASARKSSPAAGFMSPRSRMKARRMSIAASPARCLGAKRARGDPMAELQEHSPFTPSPTKRRRRLSFDIDPERDGYENDAAKRDALDADYVTPLDQVLSPSCISEREQPCVVDEDEAAALKAKAAADKRQVKLWEAVREIVSTEETYWKSLLQVRLAYLEAAQSVVKPKEVQDVFGNTPELQARAYELLLALRKACAHVPDRGEGPGTMTDDEVDTVLKSLANIFLEFLPSAQPEYTAYCAGYTLAHERCNQLEKDNSRFRGMLRKARREHDVPCIYDLLILPVQRLPRYQILLMAVIGYVDESRFSGAKARLEAALECIVAMNVVVDEAIRKSENERQMEELKSSFAPENHVTFERPGRFLVRHAKVKGVVNQYYRCQLPTGPLTWLSAEDTADEQEFFLILFNDAFVIALESKTLPAAFATSGKHTICETLPVDLVFLVEEGDEFRSRSRLSVSAPNGVGIQRQPGKELPALPRQRSKARSSFQFVSPRLGLTIQCKCRSDVVAWRTALQDAVTEHLKKNPTLKLTRTHIVVQKDAELEQWHCVEDVLCRSTDRIPRDRYNAANIADDELLKLQNDPRFQEFYQKRCAATSHPAPSTRIGSRVINKVSKAAISPMRLLSPGGRIGKRGATTRRLFGLDHTGTSQ
mmetsp:Transcript_348/g.1216  ORF Transcript_348/g.1216 Transcript_348/m.1216 type:complete len:754 (+) Transcript_348:61-2322(+)